MTSKFRIGMNVFLFLLVILDLVLSSWTLFFPEHWFRFFNDAPPDDPQGILFRTGALWAAFTLWQLVALLRWQKEPYWLAVIAGVRLTEIFTDWVWLYAADHVTWAAWVAWGISPPGNLVFGIFLIWAYKRVTSEAGGYGT